MRFDLTYFCFFDNISDYLRGTNFITLSMGSRRATIPRHLILLKSVKCGNIIIEVPQESILYGFLIWIHDDSSEQFFKELKKHFFFRKAIFCNAREINGEFLEQERLPQGKYFDESKSIGIVQYAYKYGYFKLDEIPEDQKMMVQKALKANYDEILEGERRAEKFGYRRLYKEQKDW